MDLNSQLERLSEMSDDELTSFAADVLKDAKEAQEAFNSDKSKETADKLVEYANAARAIKAEKENRKAQSEEMTAAAEEAAAAVVDLLSPENEDEEEKVTEAEEDAPADETVEEDVAPEADVPAEEDKDKEEAAVKEEKKEEDVPVIEEVPVPEPEEVVVEEEAPADEDDKKKEEAASKSDEKKDDLPEDAEAPAEDDDKKNKEETAAVKDADKKKKDDSTAEDDAAKAEAEEDEEEKKKNMEKEALKSKDNRPAAPEKVSPTIIASADNAKVRRGDILPNMKALGEVINDIKQRVRGTAIASGERTYAASIVLPEVPERTLVAGALPENSRKIEDYISAQPSLVASGGLYGPTADYDDVYEFEANTERPVKEGLPNFRAEQGGIRYYSPTVLADLEGAVSIWTIEDDLKAAQTGGENLEKPALVVKAGKPIEALVDAVPLILTFGNIGNIFHPELAERHLRIGMQLQARVAEQHLLTRIATLSTWVTTEQKLGIARDFFVAVETAAAGYRNRQRISGDADLVAIVPVWVKNAIRADLTMSLPGDDSFGKSDADIEAWFKNRHIRPIFALDGESTQYFGKQEDTAGTGDLTTRDPKTRIDSINPAAKTAKTLVGFPEKLVWYLFQENTFLFLDGGQLDLGVVRDSILNKKNDYQMFFETFEGVAKLGPESLRIETPVKVNGASAGTIEPK